MRNQLKYLLLTSFTQCTLKVTGRVFPSSIYGPGAMQEGHELKWRKQDTLTSSTDRDNEVSKMFIITTEN